MSIKSHISLIDLSKQLPFEIDNNLKKELCFGETLIISCGHYEGEIGEESSEVDSWPCYESIASEHSEHKVDLKQQTIEIADHLEEEALPEETPEDDDFHFFFFPDCNKPIPPKDSNASLVIENGFPRLKLSEDVTEKCTCNLDSKGKCKCFFKFPCHCGGLTESECNCDTKEICICEDGLPKPICTCENAQICLCFNNSPKPLCKCEEIQKPCICDQQKYPFPLCGCKHKPTEKNAEKSNEEQSYTEEETSIEEPCECNKIEPKSHCQCKKGQYCTCEEVCFCDVQKTCVCESTSSKERICGDVNSTEICSCEEAPVVCDCTGCPCFEINICKCDNPEDCKCNHIICGCTKPCICDTKQPKECVCLDPSEQLKKGLLCTCRNKANKVDKNKLKKVKVGKDGYRWCHDVDPHHTFFGYGYGRHDKIDYQEKTPQKVHILGLHDKKDDIDETCPLHGIKAPQYKKKIRKPSLDCCSSVGGITISVETLGEARDKFLVQVVSYSSKEGLKAGSKLVSIVDCNLHTMEENRTEHISKKDTTKEKRSYMAIAENGYYNKVTKICGERTVVKRLFNTLAHKVALWSPQSGANIVLLRYFGLRRYKGTVKTDTVLMGGEICESIYVCHGVNQAVVNGKPLFVVKVERHIIEPNGNLHQTLTVLTLRGYTVSHEWADNCYVLHINPLLDIIPEKDEIEAHAPLRENWRNDLQLFSDYLDMKSTRTSEGGRYMSENGALSNVVREYLQSLLMLKPVDALHFTHHYFNSMLSALELPHNEYFEPTSKHVRYYFFED